MSAPAADLDRRFYAFAVDRGVAWAIDAVAVLLVWQYVDQPGVAVAVVLAVMLVVGAAFAVVLGLTGSSPGNALLGLRVQGAGTGAPIGVGRALQRQLILGVATLPTFGLGVATLAWTATMDPSGRRHGWHDQVSGSEVVDVRPVPAEPEPVPAGPQQVVNLTAMRLVPAPPLPPPPPTPPPSGPPTPPPRQQLGYPLVPEPAAPEPRWQVTFDTGESFVVEGLALVGRRPEAQPEDGVRHLVPLRSEDMSLSKTHAHFQVVTDGTLVVTDRGSTNGSFLIRQGAARELAPGRPTTLLDGDRVRFGDREMTVDRQV
ncbi:RDD family protein [Nocardioides sp. SR21]|uniref:RDD family protein n=1 Tax=Nocardioides sp. SR21 TaxID=2919501 RepID=UPI0027DFAFD4|nr:RDD family protein [Nocardioides sp. SR21]